MKLIFVLVLLPFSLFAQSPKDITPQDRAEAAQLIANPQRASNIARINSGYWSSKDDDESKVKAYSEELRAVSLEKNPVIRFELELELIGKAYEAEDVDVVDSIGKKGLNTLDDASKTLPERVWLFNEIRYRILLMLADVQLSQGQFDEALKFFSQANDLLKSGVKPKLGFPLRFAKKYLSDTTASVAMQIFTGSVEHEGKHSFADLARRIKSEQPIKMAEPVEAQAFEIDSPLGTLKLIDAPDKVALDHFSDGLLLRSVALSLHLKPDATTDQIAAQCSERGTSAMDCAKSWQAEGRKLTETLQDTVVNEQNLNPTERREWLITQYYLSVMANEVALMTGKPYQYTENKEKIWKDFLALTEIDRKTIAHDHHKALMHLATALKRPTEEIPTE